MRTTLAICLTAIVCRQTIDAGAQPDSNFIRQFQEQRKRINDKVGQKFFFPDNVFAALSNAPFSSDELTGPAIVYVGFASCAPCRFQAPVMVEVANRPDMSHAKFFYATFDDLEDVEAEFGKLSQSRLQRVRFIRAQKDDLRKHELAFSFPTVYFIHSNGIIDTVETGGRTDDRAAVKEHMIDRISGLK